MILPKGKRKGERIGFVEDLVTAPEVATALEPFNSLVPALAFKQITRLSNISFFIFSLLLFRLTKCISLETSQYRQYFPLTINYISTNVELYCFQIDYLNI